MTRRERNELLRLASRLECRLASPLPNRCANARGLVLTRRALRRWLKRALHTDELPGPTMPSSRSPGGPRRAHMMKPRLSNGNGRLQAKGRMTPLENLIRDLTLMLLYLTSWAEKTPFGAVRRSWKGYPFETLDELAKERVIDGSRGAKSVRLTEAGEKEARRVLARYGLNAPEPPNRKGERPVRGSHREGGDRLR